MNCHLAWCERSEIKESLAETCRLSPVVVDPCEWTLFATREDWASCRNLTIEERDVGRLRFLKKCRDLGFPLADAKVLLSLSESRDGDCQSVKTMAEIHTANVRAKIAELRMLEAALSELTVNCSGDSVACPMLDQLQTA